MLPIEAKLPEILSAIQQHQVVLIEATPGSGKTTQVPLALVKSLSGKILVLEPRRVATKWAAQYVASLMREKIAETIGYLFRFEQKTSDKTRLIYLTEGTFLRLLESNPELSGVDAVVLDEFHERHLATDLSFGLLHGLMNKWPKAPKLIIMSATLNEAGLKNYFPHLHKITVTAPVFPLTIEYAPKDADWQRREIEKKVLWAIQKAWGHPGDMLVFLPGLFEIKKVQSLLLERLGDFPARVLTLHSQDSSPEHELMAVTEEKKIILASNIAESSVTIPGVRIVIDSGLMREASYSALSLHVELETKECSQASAIQRAGRAARQGEGFCYRLYSEENFKRRAPFSTPEIHLVNLADVLLELKTWQLSPQNFALLDSPAEQKWVLAQEELTELKALEAGHITRLGKEIHQVPLPLRAARVWWEARERADQKTFEEICYTLSHWLEKGEEAKRLFQRIKAHQSRGKLKAQDEIWLTGFKDRTVRVRSEDVITYRGDVFKLSPEVKKQWNPKHTFAVLLEISGTQKLVTRMISVEGSALLPYCERFEEVFYDNVRHHTIKRVSLKLGSITVEVSEQKTAEAAGASKLKAELLKWVEEFKQSGDYRRWQLICQHLLPDKNLHDFEWDLFLEEFLLDMKKPDPETHHDFLRRLNEELQLFVDPSFSITLRKSCHERFELHEKKSCPIHYELNQPPWIEAYIQDFYGTKTHPSLLGGKLPLTVHLWGPHGRALQVTGDLPGFWQRHYPQLKKELQREYPRHFWPEDPLTAAPLLRLPRNK